MGEPLKSLSARARLGAALPAHYPGTPANFEDVSDESTLALGEVLSTISTEDAALVNQIRRFRGPWLLSRADDHDHKILTASKTFVADMKYARGALVGHNCKKLQGTKKCAVNDSCNKQLSAAFRNTEDVNVVLRTYDGAGASFGSSLTVLVLRAARGCVERRAPHAASPRRLTADARLTTAWHPVCSWSTALSCHVSKHSAERNVITN